MNLFWHYTNIGKEICNETVLSSIQHAQFCHPLSQRILEISTVDDFTDCRIDYSFTMPHFLCNTVDIFNYHNIIENYVSYRIKPGNSLWNLFGNKWETAYNHKRNERFRKTFPDPAKIDVNYSIYGDDEHSYKLDWVVKNTDMFDVCRYLICQQERQEDFMFINNSLISDVPENAGQFIFGSNTSDVFFCPKEKARYVYDTIIDFDLCWEELKEICDNYITIESYNFAQIKKIDNYA